MPGSTHRLGRHLRWGIVAGWVVSVLAGVVSPSAAEPLPSSPDVGLRLFVETIAPLLQQRCLACHQADRAEGGLNLATREGMLRGGERGQAIVSGQGAASLLIKLVRRTHEPQMPAEGDPLTEADCRALAAWIDLGAPYHHSLAVPVSTASGWTHRRVPPEAREFWSFQPLRTPQVPFDPDQPGSSPIDAFLQASRQARGLTATLTADRRTLIRRLTRDLLGISPTSEDVAEFVADPDPLAYERLVGRLLADPRQGERAARFWLDVARFAESHGFEHDYDRPTAYHYRDFVVSALNDNLPFDEFLRWQIAGDELAPHDRRAWMATGFLAAGVHSTQITKNEVARQRYDELDDMVGTLGTAMLGLTLSCARCHDHKSDPIPQADYYRLVSAFTRTVRSEVELDFEPAAHAAALTRFHEEHRPYREAVQHYEQTELPLRLQEWLQTPAARALDPDWLSPRQIEPTSTADTKWIALADGSWLATGSNPEHDVYVIHGRTRLPSLSAIRIEALTDLSLVHGGPGRAEDGNFALSSIRVSASRDSRTALPAADSEPLASPVALAQARATFEQLGLPVSATLDDQPETAWAVDPQFGRAHAAVFDFQNPWLTAEREETRFTIRLEFASRVRHAIGRLRVSFSSHKEPPLENSEPFREEVWLALRTPLADWSHTDRQQVLDWYRQQDAGWQQLDAQRVEHAARSPQPRLQKVLVATEGRPAITLHTQAEKEYLDATHYLQRGDDAQPQGVAALGVLQALSTTAGEPLPWQQTPPPGSQTTFQRQAVARWLTDPWDGAGALAARVAVNRVWQQHFGRGLVATSSDFGAGGERPTHPELLEWLAAEFVRSGWDVKWLRRQIVTSAAYQQAVASRAEELQGDPEDVWYTRWQPRRLEAEALRDSVLNVAGLLDDRMKGPGQLDPQQTRRSLYFTIKRSQLPPMLTAFDAPDGSTGIAVRAQTTVAPQTLWLLNDPLMQRAADELARQIASATDPSNQVQAAYQRVYQRDPTAAELRVGTDFLTADPVNPARLSLYCQGLLCVYEFLTLD